MTTEAQKAKLREALISLESIACGIAASLSTALHDDFVTDRERFLAMDAALDDIGLLAKAIQPGGVGDLPGIDWDLETMEDLR